MGNPQELTAPRIISAALSLPAPVSLIAQWVLRLPPQVLRLTPSMSQVAAMLLILSFKLWLLPCSPPPLQLPRAAPQAVTAVYLHESQCGWVWPMILLMLMKLLPVRCCELPHPRSPMLSLSVFVLHAASHKLPGATSVILPLYLRLFPPLLLLLLCHSPYFFFSSVTPHSQSICSLCLCSDQCWAVHVLMNTVFVSAVRTVLPVYSSEKNRCHISLSSRGRACLLQKILKPPQTQICTHAFIMYHFSAASNHYSEF